MESQVVNRKFGKSAIRACVFIIGLLSLLGTWYVMYWGIAGVTEGRLVVKSCCPPSPPLGSLARMISDFFEVPPGSILPAVLVLTTSATIFVLRMARSRQRFWLPLAFAVTNLLFFVVAFLLIVVADGLADLWCPPNYVGYLATGPSILAIALALGLLFWIQVRIVTVVSSIWRRIGGVLGNSDSISDREDGGTLA